MLAGTPGFDQHVKALAGVLGNSFGAANANRMALAQIYHQLTQQAQTQGYQDVYMELSWASIVLVALAFMLSKNRAGSGPGAGAMH